MEVRNYNPLYDNVVTWGKTYPRMKAIPQLKRNGFKGELYGVSPIALFSGLLADPRIETLMKAGETEAMKYFLSNSTDTEEIWGAYLIAKRHRYHIGNFTMWVDYLRMLETLKQDLRNPPSGAVPRQEQSEYHLPRPHHQPCQCQCRPNPQEDDRMTFALRARLRGLMV